MTTFIDTDRAPLRRSIDALLEVYLSWRVECTRCSRPTNRGPTPTAAGALAYAGYVAALDREEHAAWAHAHQIERVIRICV
jgi:hypothetical protein